MSSAVATSFSSMSEIISSMPQRVDGADIADHVRGKPAEVVALFARFLQTLEACGPVRIEATKNGFALHGTKRIFAGVRATKSGLRGFLNLTRRIEDPRF